MGEADAQNVTQKLVQWGKGDRGSLNELALLVHDELRRIAHKHMRNERPGHTLQTTALLNEAYLRLINQAQVNWRDRAHFFGIAAHIMRQILVDYARRAGREKRGGDVCILPLDEALAIPARKSAELVALDEALDRLAIKDPRKARVVELRYFGGLSVEETAEVLQVHPNTVVRDWTLVRAWLRRELGAKD
jgi:RNA polymerase sigma factor (TIGR02999 family)